MKTSLFPLLLAALTGFTFAGCESEHKPGAAIWYEPDEVAEDEKPEALPSPETKSSADHLTAPRSTDPASEKQTDVTQDDRYGIGVSLDGFRPFPKNDAWNLDISQAAVDPQSDDILTYIGLDGHLHPDFGSGEWEGSKIGIPYIVVSGDQPRVAVRYGDYADESDPGPFPLPFNTPVEGDPYDEGDRHAIVIDRDNWKLYELYRAFPINGGASWRADSGAIFDLKTNTQRPRGWTSADAAGLPIFPGLVRYDEVGEQKEIRHALRFTLNDTRRAFVPPASHWASSNEHPLLPPLGIRVRLKADVPIDDYPASVQVILRALKKYGMILADNGSDWFISGSPDERWDNDELRTLRKIRITDLEIIRMDGLVTPYTF